VSGLFSDATSVFTRDRRTWALTQLCLVGDSICPGGVALRRPHGVGVSGDGRNVYVAADDSNAVAVFARDRRTGALTQLPGSDGCISEDGSDGGEPGIVCADGVALDTPLGATVSRDGRNVYVASFESSAVAVFARDRKGHLLAAR
jgi:DNA-binding beta-propeller fold protein YncE